ncbi:MAG: TetR/AcrR family transcriptional regulator [Clostridia bacterium]|nr:TetR/AcrR family transcriptional regulator [Clostridia bacterium]
MANIRNAEQTAEIRKKVLVAATQLFIEKGYEQTTIKDISRLAGLPTNTVFYKMKTKEDILCALLNHFLDGVFDLANSYAKKYTDDEMLHYMVYVCLQLYMAETSEDMRNLYLNAYSLPKVSEAIRLRLTKEMQHILSSELPELESKDYYEIEIASSGIMRGYISVPCDMYFTAKVKSKRCVEMMMLIYRFKEEKIQQAIEFVEKFDFKTMANQAIKIVFEELAVRSENISNTK